MRTSKYTKEFKDSTIQLILNNNESVSKIATDLDIHIKTLYNWIKAGCVIKKEDTQLNNLIEAIFIQGRKNYGTRRIQNKLKELYSLILSRKRIAGIMKDLNLKVKMKRRYKNTTDSNHKLTNCFESTK